ncbi:nucleotide sugar dehydrogenase [Telmatospirillum sp.]|uniref:nucleotide sugar dehydrogenase n=1 Tax=Telmatospirillum sp. TaxID=2079197 RepID=UPI00283F243B|nr:nucleotide sugar dehydrogenase [Telmatospirillum sp.]MDR3441053.1 nucleotide sugar dehydrogenase [Telmatospirillum sp.]
MSHPRIAVIGLGYVGLPLAVAIARHFPTTGFDINPGRIAELSSGIDRTGEVEPTALRSSTLRLTGDAEKLRGCDIYIVTVPTPVDADNKPDLSPLLKACRTVGSVLGTGAIVVFESTVYPGLTEDICGPALAAAAGTVCGRDFFLGYSPERINPGDHEHTVDRIVKVVAGQTRQVTDTLAVVYGSITSGGVFQAASIRVAEAAKVIENSQRDINIAFINEVTMICQRLGISVQDVLETSGTKWNFLNFKPGLVGGHCIGVDPFYLAECALKLGYHPEIILAGRRINDSMGGFVAQQIDEALGRKPSRILVLGLTFKENVPDLRNSKVVDVITGLKEKGHDVEVHDAFADREEALRVYGLSLLPRFDDGDYDCIVGAVPHRPYAAFTAGTFAALVRPGGLIADIKGMWRHLTLPEGLRRWQL